MYGKMERNIREAVDNDVVDSCEVEVVSLRIVRELFDASLAPVDSINLLHYDILVK